MTHQVHGPRSLGMIAAASLALLIATGVVAEALALDPPPPDIRLMPIVVPPVQGANGTTWIVENFLQNHGDEELVVTNIVSCPVLVELCVTKIPPRTAIRWATASRIPGHTFWSVLDPSRGRDFSISTFVRNIADDVDSWGTRIPSPSVQNDFFPGSFRLAPIPAAATYRLSLRVYARGIPQSVPYVDIEIRELIEQQPPPHNRLIEGALLAHFRLDPVVAETQQGSRFESHSLFSTLPVLPPDARVAIRVSTPSATVPLWGFASLVNNETQHVTIFAP